MDLPERTVTLTPEQIADLNGKLSKMRHDINNVLASMLAAAELARLKPDMADKMLARLVDQPARVTGMIKDFSAEFEKVLAVKRS